MSNNNNLADLFCIYIIISDLFPNKSIIITNDKPSTSRFFFPIRLFSASNRGSGAVEFQKDSHIQVDN